MYFSEAPDLFFQYYKHFPENPIYRVSPTGLQLYGLYRDTVYASYKPKKDLAQDIKETPKKYVEIKGSKAAANPLFNEPVYHYSINASLNAIKEWRIPGEKMESFVVYQNPEHKKVGFINFQEKNVEGKKVVYIAQAGVANRGKGLGRHLMECVLARYPVGTEFYILTRIFNEEAIRLYRDRLNFTPIDDKKLKYFGLDNRYCGFNHTTTAEEINTIRAKQLLLPPDNKSEVKEASKLSL